MEIILTAVRSQSPNGRQGVPFGAGDGDGVAVGPGRLCIAWDTWYWVLGTGCCDWSTVYWRWRERANMLHMREAAAKVLVLVILLWIYGKHV